MNRSREQWKKLDAMLCASSNSRAATMHLLLDAQADIEQLHRMMMELVADLESAGPVPSVEALQNALESVSCFHDMSSELIAPRMRNFMLEDGALKRWKAWRAAVTTPAPVSEPGQQAEQKPVAVVLGHVLNDDGEPRDNTLAYLADHRVLPMGTKLYTSPPASPDTDALVDAMEAGLARLTHDERVPNEVSQELAALLIAVRAHKAGGADHE